jgi:hypothetical protein
MTGSNKSGLYDKRILDGSFLNPSADGALSIKRLHMGAVHRSVQPSIIISKPPVFAKSPSESFADFRPPKEAHFWERPTAHGCRLKAILRELDQQTREAKEHQRRSDALER